MRKTEAAPEGAVTQGDKEPAGSTQIPRHNMEYLFFAGLLLLWFVFQMWVLPKAGVST